MGMRISEDSLKEGPQPQPESSYKFGLQVCTFRWCDDAIGMLSSIPFFFLFHMVGVGGVSDQDPTWFRLYLSAAQILWAQIRI